MKPVIVLALNPSIDAEWRVDELRREEKNTVESERRWAGGKGVNVARWLAHFGSPGRLILPLGGANGAELAGYLRSERLPFTPVEIMEPTRVNVVVTSEAGGQMRFNPRGPRLSRTEWRKLFTRVEGTLVRNTCQILTGALPRDAAPGTYAKLALNGARKGVRTLLDCDGPALSAGLGARPFLVKPNTHELAVWAGRRLASERTILAAARGMSARTRGWVLVSRGVEGALLVHAPDGQAFKATAPAGPVRNTVGAGDALLAAVAARLGQGDDAADWLRWGVAAGTAATRQPAGRLPSRSLLRDLWQQVRVTGVAE